MCDQCSETSPDDRTSEDDVSKEEEENMFENIGSGFCTAEGGSQPPNYSADGHTMESCGDKCMNEENCLGFGLSRNGRCALWMDEVNLSQELVGFGMPKEGSANWNR
eukprot:UN15051